MTLTFSRPSPCVSTLPLNCCNCDTRSIRPEFTITSPTLVKSTALVRMSTVPSSMMRLPPPRSIELPAERTSVSKSSKRSKVRFPPSRSTFTRALISSAPAVNVGITTRTSPEPVIVPVVLAAVTCDTVSSNKAPASTTNVAEVRTAPSSKATLSVSAPSTPATVISAAPRFAAARKVTPPVVSIVVVSSLVEMLLRFTSGSSSMLVITTVPVPLTVSPLMSTALAVKVTILTTISLTSTRPKTAADPTAGVNT